MKLVGCESFSGKDDVIALIREHVTVESNIHAYTVFPNHDGETSLAEIFLPIGGMEDDSKMLSDTLPSNITMTREDVEKLIELCLQTPVLKSRNGAWDEYYELDFVGEIGTMKISFALKKAVIFGYNRFDRALKLGIVNHVFWSYKVIDNRWHILGGKEK